MPVSKETIHRSLFDALRSLRLDPISLNSKGDPNEDVENADVFKFEYKDQSGKALGKAWATIENKELIIYTDKDFTSNPKFEEFAIFMKNWAQRRLLNFKITDKENLQNDMKKRTVMKTKETLGEGYYPLSKKSSYSDNIPQVKIILQHTRQLEEGEQRFRNIARIFVENTNGERFLLPTNRPGLARVYARHIAEGGTPYDDKAKHITTLVEEYSKMAGFVRATRKGEFNESALKLVNEGLNHYNTLRMTLQGMTSHRGYNKYFENYTPILNEETDDETNLNELFVQETLDPRIESVMPILKRLSKNITEMNEVNELSEWAETITEVEDETTKTLAEPASDMLDEIGIAKLKSGEFLASDRIKKFKQEIDKLKASNGDPADIAKYEKAVKHYEDLIKKMKGYPGKMQAKNTAKKLSAIMPAKMRNVAEAPGAETLKHNQDTEKSNLKAFDLEEGDMEEGTKDVMKSVRKKFRQSAVGRAREYGYRIEEGFSPASEVADQIIDSLGGEEGLTSDDIYRAVEEYQSMMDNPHKVDIVDVAQIVMDRLNIADEVGEGLDANQKRAGQLGPTDSVGKNEKNLRGKLVGASESVNNEDQMLLDRITKLAGK